jgi:hypothetical protein
MPRPPYPRERAPGIHWIGGCEDPRAGLDDVEKRKLFTLLGLELQTLSRPARRLDTNCAMNQIYRALEEIHQI